ncbi:hypothetical protein ACNKHR_25590 [Shigella flexneri]
MEDAIEQIVSYLKHAGFRGWREETNPVSAGALWVGVNHRLLSD